MEMCPAIYYIFIRVPPKVCRRKCILTWQTCLELSPVDSSDFFHVSVISNIQILTGTMELYQSTHPLHRVPHVEASPRILKSLFHPVLRLIITTFHSSYITWLQRLVIFIYSNIVQITSAFSASQPIYCTSCINSVDIK